MRTVAQSRRCLHHACSTHLSSPQRNRNQLRCLLVRKLHGGRILDKPPPSARLWFDIIIPDDAYDCAAILGSLERELPIFESSPFGIPGSEGFQCALSEGPAF